MYNYEQSPDLQPDSQSLDPHRSPHLEPQPKYFSKNLLIKCGDAFHKNC